MACPKTAPVSNFVKEVGREEEEKFLCCLTFLACAVYSDGVRRTWCLLQAGEETLSSCFGLE